MTALSELRFTLSQVHKQARHLAPRRLARAFSSSSSQYPFLQELQLKEGAENSGVFYGNQWHSGQGTSLTSLNPSTNEPIATISAASTQQYAQAVSALDKAKPQWSHRTPTPLRGELVRQLAVNLRKHKSALGHLVSLEMGKILSEGLGEVQECIDICDYAVGLSRQIDGSLIPSERPDHTMMERYHPLSNHVGVITAFNFPTAVYFWNTALSLIVGNTQLWKPAPSTSLVAIACQKIVNDTCQAAGVDPGITALTSGGGDIGQAMAEDRKMDVVSFTGSTAIGRKVGTTVQQRFGRSILELGGNNALIVMNDANLPMAVRAAVFGAVGTAGQRCTTTRRLLLHAEIYDEFIGALLKAYKSVTIGNPLGSNGQQVLCGPLHNKQAVDNYKKGIEAALEQGGKILTGGRVLTDQPGNFVEPTVIEISSNAQCVQHEVFAPILYVHRIASLEEAIAVNNSVPQGLSSALFTESNKNVWKWASAAGSDCGIVNVNMGTSGAEIGGAFGGNKETGGGRESGSDAWKAYCRRSTVNLSYADTLPLAQGVKFDI